MAKTKTVRRITRVFDDKENERLNNAPNYHSRRFAVEGEKHGDTVDFNKYSTRLEDTWEKLGKPHRIRVTITVLDDDA